MSRLLDIRQGELARVGLSFASLMLVVGSYTLVKSVRDAIFLAKFGVTELSLIAIGLAVLTGVIVSWYLRVSAKLPRLQLIFGTNVMVIGSLIAIWLGLRAGPSAILPWVLYIWSSIYGVFVVMQFWLVAGDLFDTREAKRLYGLLGAGATAGGLVGGALARMLAGAVGTETLLLLAAAMLGLETGCFVLLWRRRRRRATRERRESGKAQSGLQTVRDNRYIRLLALSVLLMTVATTLLDWQFKGTAKIAFAGHVDDMAAYFGSLYAYLSAISFLFQTVVTGWVLRRFGVGTGLLVLPIGLMISQIGTVGIALIPGLSLLTATSGAKVTEGSLRFAIDKASFELLWLPVPSHVKESGKAFVDTVMDRLGTGVTGLVWLLVIAIGWDSAETLSYVSYINIAIIGAWLYIVWNTRRAYVDSLRNALQSRRLDLESLNASVAGAEAADAINIALSSEDAREVGFGLYLLDGWHGALPDLSGVLRLEDPTVKIEALRILADRGDRDHREQALACLKTEHKLVQRAVVIYLRESAPVTGSDPLVEQLVARAEIDDLTLAAIQLGSEQYGKSAEQVFSAAVEASDVARRVAAAEALAACSAEAAQPFLERLVDDSEDMVVNAAIRAIGRAQVTALAPRLAARLADRKHRAMARPALGVLGDEAVVAVREFLARDDLSEGSQYAALNVLGSLGSEDAIELLLAHVADAPSGVAGKAAQALARIAATNGTRAPRARVEPLIIEWLQRCYGYALLLDGKSWAELRESAMPAALEQRIIREHLNSHMDVVFRLLALLYRVSGIRDAYRGVRSANRAERSNSIELLDNLLTVELRSALLPLVEGQGSSAQLVAAARQLGVTSPKEPLITALLGSREPLIRALAVWIASEGGAAADQAQLQQLQEQEQATVVLALIERVRLLAKGAQQGDDMSLTIIEKAIKLQKVDVLGRAAIEDLAYVAQIADEIECADDEQIYSAGDAPDALYVVVEGQVRLHRGDQEVALLQSGEAFGAWALVDESPRVASATVTKGGILLKVSREDFLAVLADRVEMVQAIFEALVGRVRTLASVVGA